MAFSTNLDLGNLSGPYMLSTEKWPDWQMAVESQSNRNVAGVSGDPGTKGYFVFTKHGCSPNEYYTISPQSHPEAVYMGSDSTGNVQIKPSVSPDDDAKWKIELKGTTRTSGGLSVTYYHFTPIAYPNWHMYVDCDAKGNVRGACGDNPGPQANILFRQIPSPC